MFIISWPRILQAFFQIIRQKSDNILIIFKFHYIYKCKCMYNGNLCDIKIKISKFMIQSDIYNRSRNRCKNFCNLDTMNCARKLTFRTLVLLDLEIVCFWWKPECQLYK